VSRRNWPDASDHPYGTWYEPYDDQARITASVSWVLSRDEVTGIATPGDVRLLDMVLDAERNRITPAEAERQLASDRDYSSPFLAMPI
jgi:hypothetical protein